MIKTIVQVVAFMLVAYTAMVTSFMLIVQVRESIAKDYMNSQCELLSDSTGTEFWYECDK